MSESGRPLVIWGASGHARVLAEFLGTVGFHAVAIFDNSSAVETSPLQGVSLHIGEGGFREWLTRWGDRPVCGAIAIGGAKGAARLEIQQRLVAHGITIVSLVHPRAFVAESARIGEGSQILVNAAVCAEAELGAACIVNTAATVDHECRLADGVHIGPGAHLAGCVAVGPYAFVGAGATVLPRVRIGGNAIVGAGAVVTRDVPDGAVVYGNPARTAKIREDRSGT